MLGRALRTRPRRHDRGTAARLAAGVALTVVFAGGLPATSAIAEPGPSTKDLKTQQKRLNDQLEVLTEQYNGLRVRLEQARRAAKVAADNARRQEKALEEVRSRVAGMAADAYKTGGVDPAVAFATANDPQALLDRSATLDYFATQDGSQIQALLQTAQSAARARKAAEQRAAQVSRLAGDLQRKQREVKTALKKVESKLGTAKPRPGGQNAPNVEPGGASAKAMGAVRAALAKLGTPYSWGGGGPNGPTYGTAQGAGIKGFDCSGLTLYAYAQVGIGLPHYTGSQFNAGVRVTQAQLKPGDLVFFYSDLHHMGMYIGGGKMVHAPQTGDVVKIDAMGGRPFAGGVRVA